MAETIPVCAAIAKIDSALAKEDYLGAERILLFWVAEAKSLKDLRGELTMESELAGLSRKMGKREQALEAAYRCFEIMEKEGLDGLFSSADIYINAATAMTAFGLSKETLPYYKKAEGLYAENMEASDPRFAAFHNNFGLALAAMGDKLGAKKSFDKAVGIQKDLPDRGLDLAITYLNLADLYDGSKSEDRAIINRHLDLAADCFDEPTLVMDDYYAFVCRKCGPVFGFYGRQQVMTELQERADLIYEGN